MRWWCASGLNSAGWSCGSIAVWKGCSQFSAQKAEATRVESEGMMNPGQGADGLVASADAAAGPEEASHVKKRDDA